MAAIHEIEAAVLQEWSEALLVAAGSTPDHARIVASALVDADIEGLASHGTLLLPMYLDRVMAGSVDPSATGEVVRDKGTQLVIDARHGFGHVVADTAVALVTARAKEHGVAVAAVRNAFHFGVAGRFARHIAQSDCVGIVSANTRPLMPAPGGAQAVVGNNPVAIAVPTTAEPLVADFALSAGAMGKIRLAESRGETIPAGWAVTNAGLPTTDAAEAIAGMLLPAGGAKGFGLAAMVDLLAGGLSAGGMGDQVRPLYGDMSVPYGSACLFMAIRIEGFRPSGEYKQAATAFADKIRRSRRAPGVDALRMPGDRSVRAREEFDGSLHISGPTLAALAQSSKRLHVDIPFLF